MLYYSINALLRRGLPHPAGKSSRITQGSGNRQASSQQSMVGWLEQEVCLYILQPDSVRQHKPSHSLADYIQQRLVGLIEGTYLRAVHINLP